MRIKHGEMTLKKQEQKQHKHQQNYRPNQWSIAAVFLLHRKTEKSNSE